MDILTGAFIFLAAGVIAVPIASKLGLGSVLGYLIAGALIGPSVFGFVADTESILHFAEFGVVMMLFLIGLELQPRVLWRMRKPILGLGGFQLLLTTLAISGITMLFGFVWQTALAIGLILALSSTAIALQILSEKKLMKAEAGKSSFAVLLFQDIAVIPIIALLPILVVNQSFNVHAEAGHGGTSIIADLETWQQTLIILGVIGSIILAGHYLTRPIFRFIATSGLREIFTAAALLLVIGIALLMNIVGLSPALGAFIAGVVLADNEYSHEIEANIDPFKALLLGLFFMTVGAGIDFSLIGSEPLTIIGLVSGLIIVKFAILFFLARRFKLLDSNQYWFSFALAQGGEFGFVLLSLSLSNKVLDREVVDILTVVVALSMVLTPILILINEKLIQPKFYNNVEEEEGEADDIDDDDNPVILAGFGRFGQVVGRLLIANHVGVTVLDHNARHIAQVRKFGYKLFYGDGTRIDLLKIAGAENAKLFIISVDGREKINEIVRQTKKHFPHLKVLVRAYDVMHVHQLQELGADYIEREVFQGSMSMGKQALKELGMPNDLVEHNAKRFWAHDEEIIELLGKHHKGDDKQYISEARLAMDEMMDILKKEAPNSESDLDSLLNPESKTDLKPDS